MDFSAEISTPQLKYCIILDGMISEIEEGKMESVGFCQWSNIFNGQIFEAKHILPSLKDGDFDIIHVILTPGNISSINSIRSCIGEKSYTKLAISVDIPVRYWRQQFHNINKLKKAILKADFISATEYTICQALEKLSGKPVYELPHPADIQKLKAYAIRYKSENHEDNRILNIPGSYKIKNLASIKQYAVQHNIRPRIVFYKDQNEKLVKKLIKNKFEMILCSNEEDFCKALLEGNAFLAPFGCPDYGKWVIYAAALGIMVIGNTLSDASRRCYPVSYTRTHSLLSCEKLFYSNLQKQEKIKYIRENAFHKVEYYNWHNMKNRFLSLIYRETRDKRFKEHINIQEIKDSVPVFHRDIRHLYGNNSLMLKKNELSVVCLVKNGMEYMNTFLNHYNALGVKHFVFIDNCSDDDTVEFLKTQDNVTVYQTNLPHKYYENEIRKTVIESLFSDSWCLCVDIDELFDYPYSDKMPLAQFLDYLNRYHYTAVIAYMLDMFSEQPGTVDTIKKNDLTKNYCYYDISEIQKDGYFNHNPNFCNYNILSSKKMQYYYGGIRWKYFGREVSKYLLIKHPLMFIDHKIEPVTDPHFCNKAYISDVTCLLKHYKFTDTFKERLAGIINNYGYFGKIEHEQYSKILNDKKFLNFYSSTAKKLQNTSDLIESGFLKVSKRYLKFMNKVCKGELMNGNNQNSIGV